MASDAEAVRFNGVLGLVTRRWYFVIAGLLVTLPLTHLATQRVSPVYTMEASVVLLAPEKTVGPGGNPYLVMGGLEAAVDVAAAGLSSDPVQERLAGTGAVSGLVERDTGTAAPILLVTVEAPSAASAAAGLEVLVDQVPATLSTIQSSAGVEDRQLIRSEVIASSRQPAVSYRPQLRAALMVLAAGVAATLMLTALADSLLLRRRRRRARAAEHAVPQLRMTEEPDDADGRDGVADLTAARGRKP
ncbi:hypothetical protein [Nocardioides lijunqiniae]|uniref:hypothetical protein n=1 Tax=Nocardioides lijunqiniae TaxID=2760832 RepID=UPI001878D133|nr:hypothetical protein [Nocardioides lijunqiniae]